MVTVDPTGGMGGDDDDAGVAARMEALTEHMGAQARASLEEADEFIDRVDEVRWTRP